MGFAYVRGTTGQGSSSSFTLNLSALPVSGNLLVIAITTNDNQNNFMSSITDNAGNTYTRIQSESYTPVAPSAEMWYAKNVTPAATTQILTFTPVNSSPDFDIVVQEFSGANKTSPLDKNTSARTDASATINTGTTGGTNYSDELIVISGHQTANATHSLASGFSNIDQDTVGTRGTSMQSKVVSTTGTQSASFATTISQNVIGIIATFISDTSLINVSDSMTLSESQTFAFDLFISKSDTITTSESRSVVTPFLPSDAKVHDNLTFSESVSVSTSFQPVIKTYLYKVYDSTGTTLIKTWTDVISEPAFAQDVNSGGSQMELELARPADNYGEGSDIAFGLQVKVYAVDTEAPNGAVIFIGFIADYKPIFGSGELVHVTLLGYGNELDNYLLDDGTTTTFAYNSMDPGAILRDVIDKYRTAGGTLNYTTSTVELTGTIVSYTFNTNSILECVDKCLELAPLGWYWYIDQATNLIHFHPKAMTNVYNFTLSKDIYIAEAEKRSEEIVNTVYFTGGGSPVLYNKYTNPASISLYGRHMLRYTDQRVTLSATATTISTTILNTFSLPTIRLNLDILDNNTFSDGFNIESIHVGDVFGVRNVTGGVGNYLDITIAQFQVLRLEYSPSIAKVTSSTVLPDVNKRIADINRNLIESQTASDPVNPSAFIILNLTDSITFTESLNIVVV